MVPQVIIRPAPFPIKSLFHPDDAEPIRARRTRAARCDNHTKLRRAVPLRDPVSLDPATPVPGNAKCNEILKRSNQRARSSAAWMLVCHACCGLRNHPALDLVAMARTLAVGMTAR
jgi:hypothetical protein